MAQRKSKMQSNLGRAENRVRHPATVTRVSGLPPWIEASAQLSDMALGCGVFGLRFILAAPRGYGFDESFVQEYRKLAPRGDLIVNGEPGHAVEQADVIYTDVWTSMGQEAEREERRRRFAGFQVNQSLLALAPAHARVMHCLPAVRGEEVSATVLDGDRSIVFLQAENRMHAQKALLKWLLVG